MMKKPIISLFVGGLLSLGMLNACDSNKNAEPEVTQMETLQDSLEQQETALNKDIENLQKSMQDLDQEFKKNN